MSWLLSLFFQVKIDVIYPTCRKIASRLSRMLPMYAVYSSHHIRLIYWALVLLITEFTAMIYVIPGFPGVLWLAMERL